MKNPFTDDFGVNFLGVICGIILFMIVVIGIIAAIAFPLDRQSCISTAHGLSLEYKWGPLEGCLYKTRGGSWIPADQYIVNHPEP